MLAFWQMLEWMCVTCIVELDYPFFIISLENMWLSAMQNRKINTISMNVEHCSLMHQTMWNLYKIYTVRVCKREDEIGVKWLTEGERQRERERDRGREKENIVFVIVKSHFVITRDTQKNKWNQKKREHHNSEKIVRKKAPVFVGFTSVCQHLVKSFFRIFSIKIDVCRGLVASSRLSQIPNESCFQHYAFNKCKIDKYKWVLR